MRRSGGAATIAAVLLSLASRTVEAQSQRYPPPPVDKDRELDRSSSLWEQAIEPGRAPQLALLAAARRLIAARTPADLAAASAKADEAITLRPQDAIGYFVRAAAQEQLGHWGQCATDYRQAIDLDPKLLPDPELRQGQSPLLGLGICLARVGRLAQAETALDRAVAHAPSGTEEWLRLGETRIAMGKLREGLEALQASTEAGGRESGTEPAPSALNLWLRALAYDRGLQTTLAEEAAQAATLSDRFFRQLTNPAVPFIHETEQHYLLGLAWESASRPELALAYFRGVIVGQPDGMWTRRAGEHVALLEQRPFPEEITRVGPAPIDAEAVKAALQRQAPQLTACLVGLPTVAFEIKVTRSRPSLPGVGPRVVPPSPGVQVTPSVLIGTPTGEALERADQCLERAALKVELPPIKDPGTWHHLTFTLIEPGAGAGHGKLPTPTPHR